MWRTALLSVLLVAPVAASAQTSGTWAHTPITKADMQANLASKLDASGGQATGLRIEPGTVWRTLEALFGEVLRPKDFGAVGDGATDDTAAFQALAAKATSLLAAGSSVKIEINGGIYAISSPLSITLPAVMSPRLAIVGNETSAFRLTGNAGAVYIANSNGNGAALNTAMVSFTGLTAMKANGTAAGADAFQIYSPYAPFVQAKINNLRCNVEASATNTTNWNSCFHGTNIVRSHIDGIIMENGGGATNNGDPTMGMAVWLDGTNGGYSADNQLLHLSMAQGFAMVAATGHVEGLQIAQGTAVGSAYCVWMPGRQRDPSTGFYDYMTLTDTHCNSAIRGVYGVEAGSAKIINNLFYATNGSTSVAPPHGRGWSRGPEPMRHMPAGSPAWAGMVPRRRPMSPAARRLPRMGGDGPPLACAMALASSCGWHSQVAPAVVALRFPGGLLRNESVKFSGTSRMPARRDPSRGGRTVHKFGP